VLELRDLPMPEPKEDEVLIRVRAVSLNGSDYEMLTGRPAFTRVWGLFRPKVHVLGSDVAGRVEAVGETPTGTPPNNPAAGFATW
jgi:NADPH:quinone reductase-like Zn-dependent oxidoreductase